MSDQIQPSENSGTPSERRSRFLNRYWPYLLTLAVCLLTMIPRLADAHFGLLDDGFNITAARQILNGDLSMSFDVDRGRYRPAYWIFFAILYKLAGMRPVWFFAANTVLFSITTLGIVYLVKRKHSPLQAGLTGLLYALAAPGFENYYTFSKGETFQMACLILCMMVTLTISEKHSWRNVTGRVVIGAVLIYLAAITKETTLVMIPVILIWAGIAWLQSRREKRRLPRAWTASIAAVLIGSLTYLFFRSLALGTAADVNEQRFALSLGALADSAVRWSGWLLRDFFYLAVVAVLLVWLIAVRKKAFQTTLTLFSLVWIGGFVAVYLPWTSANDYYLLPMSAGVAVLTGSALAQAFETPSLNTSKKVVRAVLLACFGVAFAGSLLVDLSTVRTQLTLDHVNSDMLNGLAENLPKDSLLLINIQVPNEYSEEIRIYLNEILNRPDVQVQIIQAGQADELTYGQTEFFVLNPIVENQMLMTVRMGVIESTVALWDKSLLEYVGQNGQLITRYAAEFTNFYFDFPRIFCALITNRGFCATPSPTLDTRIFRYGWDLYQVTQTGLRWNCTGELEVEP